MPTHHLESRETWRSFLGATALCVLWAMFSAVKASVQALLFAIILLPLAVLYLFGLQISTAISLWRLIQHDYDGKVEDGGGNLKPALNVLYSLAVIQGAVFCYKIYFSRREKYLVQTVCEDWKDDKAAVPAVREYLRETRAGCEKDPSFARCRNLATYAVDLIESSRSPDSYLSGIKILDVLLRYSDQHLVLIRHLVGWGSSGHVLRKLLGTIGSGSPYDGETRKRATNIVKHLAKEICLEQFPGGIQHITSMLDDDDEADWGIRLITSMFDDDDDGRGGAADRVKDVLLIIGDLVTSHEGNRRVISSTQGLLSRVVALLGGADGLHPDHHDSWDGVACIIAPLIADRGKAGMKVRREISTSNEAIGAMGSVLKCVECHPRDRIKANGILVDLSLSTDASTEENLATPYKGIRSENLIGILAYSFFPREGDSVNGNTREYRVFAYKKLAKLSLQSKNSAKIISRAKDDVLSNLISMLLDAGNNSTDRKCAAKILKNLCSHYTKDDECFDILKKALTDAMPKVLREVFGWSTGEEMQEITEASGILLSKTDTELGNGCASLGNARNSNSSETGAEAHNLFSWAPGVDLEKGCASKDNTGKSSVSSEAEAGTESLAPSADLEKGCSSPGNTGNSISSEAHNLFSWAPGVDLEKGCASKDNARKSSISLEAGTKSLAPGADLEKGCASPDNARNSVPSSEAHNNILGTDLEKGCTPEDNAMNLLVPPSHEENGDQDKDYRKLKEAVLSLCTMVHEKIASVDEDLARRLDKMAAVICLHSGKPIWTFASLVSETQEVFDQEKEARALAHVDLLLNAIS